MNIAAWRRDPVRSIRQSQPSCRTQMSGRPQQLRSSIVRVIFDPSFIIACWFTTWLDAFAAGYAAHWCWGPFCTSTPPRRIWSLRIRSSSLVGCASHSSTRNSAADFHTWSRSCHSGMSPWANITSRCQNRNFTSCWPKYSSTSLHQLQSWRNRDRERSIWNSGALWCCSTLIETD